VVLVVLWYKNEPVPFHFDRYLERLGLLPTKRITSRTLGNYQRFSVLRIQISSDQLSIRSIVPDYF
jgi:hypothetical protein